MNLTFTNQTATITSTTLFR